MAGTEQFIHVVRPSPRGASVALRHFDDVVSNADLISLEERVANDAHQVVCSIVLKRARAPTISWTHSQSAPTDRAGLSSNRSRSA
jgi:hypothetical protein